MKMKKILIIIFASTLILTGCDSKEEVKNNENNTTNEVENIEKTEENVPKEETNKSEEKEEEPKEPEKEQIKEEKPKDEEKDSCNSSNGETKEETTKPQEPTCTPKKFDNKYSYVYTTKEECISKGNDAFMNVYENVDSSIFTYGCQAITDDCGTTWYGVYFNRWSSEGGDSVDKVYY